MIYQRGRGPLLLGLAVLHLVMAGGAQRTLAASDAPECTRNEDCRLEPNPRCIDEFDQVSVPVAEGASRVTRLRQDELPTPELGHEKNVSRHLQRRPLRDQLAHSPLTQADRDFARGRAWLPKQVRLRPLHRTLPLLMSMIWS